MPCRSLLIAQELLNTKEIVLMHHTGKSLGGPLNFRASPAAHHSCSMWLLDGRVLQCACVLQILEASLLRPRTCQMAQ